MLKFRRAPSPEDSAALLTHDRFQPGWASLTEPRALAERACFRLAEHYLVRRSNLGLSFAAGSPREVAARWKSWATRLNTLPTSMQMTLQTRDR